MSIEYAGSPAAYPITITIMEDGDFTDAAGYAVGLEQLADRTAYLLALVTGGVSFDFTDATFHGTTTFADGSIVATGLSSIAIATTGAIGLAPAAGLNVNGAMTVTGVSSFAAANFAGLVDCADQANFQGEVFLHADTHLYGILRHTTYGRELKRTAELPEAAHNLTIHEASIFTVVALSGDQSYPLLDSDAEEGDRLRVNAMKNTTAFSAVISYGAKTWFLRNQTSQIVWIEFLFTGAGWIVNDAALATGLFNG